MAQSGEKLELDLKFGSLCLSENKLSVRVSSKTEDESEKIVRLTRKDTSPAKIHLKQDVMP